MHLFCFSPKYEEPCNTKQPKTVCKLCLGLYDMKNDPKEDIPKSCQLPLDVQHITQLLNMERLKQADLTSASISSKSGECKINALALIMHSIKNFLFTDK